MENQSNTLLNTSTMIISIFGAVSFIIWALALMLKGASSNWAWFGGISVGVMSLAITALSRWFK